MRQVGEAGDAGILNALKLHGAAAAEADQDVAVEGRADGIPFSFGLTRSPSLRTSSATSKSRIEIHAVLVAGEIDEGVGAFAALERVVAADALARRDLEVGIERVIARAPVDDVIAKAADRDVVAFIAQQIVGADAAVEDIVAYVAPQLVGAAFAVDDIVALAGPERIVAIAAVESCRRDRGC